MVIIFSEDKKTLWSKTPFSVKAILISFDHILSVKAYNRLKMVYNHLLLGFLISSLPVSQHLGILFFLIVRFVVILDFLLLYRMSIFFLSLRSNFLHYFFGD